MRIGYSIHTLHETTKINFQFLTSPNYVEISTNSVNGIYDIGHSDYVKLTLPMTCQGTWALILAQKWISARTAGRKLKISTKAATCRV